jgi:putative ABC transport system permease protein
VGVIRRKVRRDLAQNKARTALVVLSIAVGVLALGLAFGTHGVMRVYLAQENEFSQTANITFKGDRLSQQAVEAVLREPGVAGAELETVATIRWRLPEETAWRRGIVIARPDYGAQQVSLVELLEGSWPGESVNPCLGGDLTLAVERQTSRHFGVPLDASIVVETGRGERACIGGIVRKPYVSPPQYGAPGTFYATPEMIARLTRVQDPNKLYVRSTPGAEGVDVVQERVKDRLERMGLAVSGSVFTTESAEFDVDLLADQLDALFLIMEVLGTGSLGVSFFLIANTMNAIIVQQVWQIGVIKAL